MYNLLANWSVIYKIKNRASRIVRATNLFLFSAIKGKLSGMQKERPIHILYDGNCPICCRKVVFLKKRDHGGKLQFSDFRESGVDSGISMDQLEKQIHAILPDGTVVSRMDVIRIAYREVGLGWLAAPTKWPLLRPLFDLLYSGIAKYRHLFSRLLPR